MYSASNSVSISHLWFAIAPLPEEFRASLYAARVAAMVLFCSVQWSKCDEAICLR
jgi:hypothetical protein